MCARKMDDMYVKEELPYVQATKATALRMYVCKKKVYTYHHLLHRDIEWG